MVISSQKAEDSTTRVIPDGRAGRVNVLPLKFPKCSQESFCKS